MEDLVLVFCWIEVRILCLIPNEDWKNLNVRIRYLMARITHLASNSINQSFQIHFKKVLHT